MFHIEQGQIAQFQGREGLGKNQVLHRCAVGKHYTLNPCSAETKNADTRLAADIELRAGTCARLHALLVGTVDDLYLLTALEVEPP